MLSCAAPEGCGAHSAGVQLLRTEVMGKGRKQTREEPWGPDIKSLECHTKEFEFCHVQCYTPEGSGG